MKTKISTPQFHLKEQHFKQNFLTRYSNQTDEYGFNCDTVLRSEIFFRFLYEEYFQVQTIGIENIPADGKAILIGNHSGVLPVDAFMTYTALLNKHPVPRRIRFLVHKWLLSAFGAGDLIKGVGGVPATYETAKELLEKDDLVFFYPEGAKGTGKPFSMRYRLDDFDPGFIKAAIETQSPIVPITTVGGDEIFPLLGNFKSLAHLMGAPYWPITPTYPWMPFSVSSLALPVKLLIKIDKPIFLDYPPEKCHDRQLRKYLARKIQYGVQRRINQLLKIRKSPFSDWDVHLVKQLGDNLYED